MEEGNSRHQDPANTTVTPLKGILMMAGSVLAVMAAIATPVLGEVLLTVLLYGKSARKAFGKK